jgi:hypothetical protein
MSSSQNVGDALKNFHEVRQKKLTGAMARTHLPVAPAIQREE